jgi:hypothetical protein
MLTVPIGVYGTLGTFTPLHPINTALFDWLCYPKRTGVTKIAFGVTAHVLPPQEFINPVTPGSLLPQVWAPHGHCKLYRNQRPSFAPRQARLNNTHV